LCACERLNLAKKLSKLKTERNFSQLQALVFEKEAVT
jgi:hypothetical protein